MTDLPENASSPSQKKWSDLFKHSVERLAIDGYRSGALTSGQVRRMLRFRTRVETHAFMKQAGVYLDYTEGRLR